MKGSIALIMSLALSSASWVQAQTSAEFGIHAAAPAMVWGQPFEITVKSTHNERLAACAFQLVASGSAAAAIIQRAVTGPLAYLNSAPVDPLADSLPVLLPDQLGLTEVFITLDSADPPGNPLDGLAPGALVTLATYTLIPVRAGTLVLSLAAPRAAETQSASGGAMFDNAGISATNGEVSLTVIGGPDLNADGRVDLRDFAKLQGCLGQAPAGSCLGTDTDADGDVDTADFAMVQHCLAGPMVSPTCLPPERNGGAP